MKKIVMMLAMMLPALAWGQGNAPEITAQAETLTVGGTSTITISLTNEGDDEYNGFQFDLYLPNGITWAKDDNNNFSCQFSDRYTGTGMSSAIRSLGSGWYRVICYSFSNVRITGKDGVLMTLDIQGSNDLAAGELTGRLSDVLLSRLDGKGIDCANSEFIISTASTRMGDVNFDKKVELTDALLVVDYVLGKVSPNFHFKYADMDGNKAIEITDALRIVDIVLGRE